MSESVELVVRADPSWGPEQLRGVRGRLWLLGLLVVPGVVGTVVRREPGPLLGSAALVAVVLVLGAAVLALLLTNGWATLTLTDTHLVLRRPGRRRRRVPRDDVAALVVGWFTEQPGRTPGGQLVVVDHAGRRRMTLPGAAWRRAEVAGLAAALDVDLRDADRRDRRLVPWGVRHPNRAAAAVVAVLLVVVLGVGGGLVALRDADAASATRTATADLDDWGTRLQRAEPTLEQLEVAVTPGDDGGLDIRVEAVDTTTSSEADPARLAALLTSACDRAGAVSADLDVATATDVEVDTVLLARPLLPDGGRVERRLTLSCEDGTALSDPVLAWFAHVSAHPFGPGVVRVSVEAGYGGTVEVLASVDSPADVDAALEVGCARGAGMDPAAAAAVLMSFSSPDIDTRLVCAEQVSP